MKNNGTNGGKDPHDVASELAVLATEQGGVLAPRRSESEAYMKHRVKNPSVVLRTDGFFGVAHARHIDRPADQSGSNEVSHLFSPNEWRMPGRVQAARDRVLGRTNFNTTRTSGFAHETITYPTRELAEKRAWALARELGDIKDWP